MTLEGVLPVWKPAGWTSHDVVARTRRLIREKRIGHTGTLDPQVTGVLPLCIGRATRIVEYVQDLPKQYEAELTIGYATDTEDWTGEVTARSEEQLHLDEALVRRVIDSFIGEIEQVPPMYSAVRVDGKRLYELARQGKEVERKSRKVHIYGIELSELRTEEPYPKIRFIVDCSKGTYIRTLCVDIGRALGSPAVMSGLVRTATGPFRREHCLTLEEIEQRAEEGTIENALLRTDLALPHIPSLHVNERLAQMAVQGRALSVPTEGGSGRRSESEPQADSEAGEADVSLLRLYGPDGRFLGLFKDEGERGLVPEKVFA